MEHATKLSGENVRIHDLLERYFASRRGLKSSAAETSFHLDEDSLAAFVEGMMSERESGPVVGHLVECRFCLHRTAELVRLDLEFADDSLPASAEAAQPTKISAVLGELFSKIFGASEAAVFAHQEKEESDEETSDKDRKA